MLAILAGALLLLPAPGVAASSGPRLAVEAPEFGRRAESREPSVRVGFDGELTLRRYGFPQRREPVVIRVEAPRVTGSHLSPERGRFVNSSIRLDVERETPILGVPPAAELEIRAPATDVLSWTTGAGETG